MGHISKNAYVFSFDLKSGYHHIEIAQDHRTFLGFFWRSTDSDNEVFHVFTVLPFGLATASVGIRLRILPYSLSGLVVLQEFKGKIIYVRLSEAN